MQGELRGKYLLVDAAGPLVQTGLWHSGEWLRWIGSREEAGRSLFAGVETILSEEKISLADLSGFFFCEGPGSMLGIRIAAMAIRSWQTVVATPLPVFTYQSHAFLAHVLLARPIAPPFHVISDARRNRWNATSVAADGSIAPLRRLEEEAVAELAGPVYRMEEVIRNEAPVPVAEVIPYSLEQEAARFLEAGLLRRQNEANPLTLESPEYQKWSGERHR